MKAPTPADLEEESFGSVSEGTASEGESDSESTEQEYQEALSSRGDVKGKAPASPAGVRAPAAAAPPPKKAGSWTDLDLSIIVALVSPIGNWLTGGDHIQNLFLIILLIFYLHQIIESTSFRSYRAFVHSKPDYMRSSLAAIPRCVSPQDRPPHPVRLGRRRRASGAFDWSCPPRAAPA